MSASDLILNAGFRANPRYNLVALDRYPTLTQHLVSEQITHLQIVGYLEPAPGSDLFPKTISRETANLFLALKEPGSLPQAVCALPHDQAINLILRLVYDGVLEIEWDGQFLSGMPIFKLLHSDSPPVQPNDLLGQLSINALMYAQALQLNQVSELSSCLYRFNSTPLSPRLEKMFGSDQMVADFLDIYGGSATALTLAKHWRSKTLLPERKWHIWAPLSPKYHPAYSDQSPTYKIYISPLIDDTADVFKIVVDTLASFPTTFKIGSDAFGLMRPDKIVAYFADYDEMIRTVDQLEPYLCNYQGQGVPFTASLSENAIISWGMDPPSHIRLWDWLEQDSWRSWIAERLAIPLFMAMQQPLQGSIQPWQFALERVRLDGIDPVTWIPRTDLWSSTEE